MSLVYLPYIHNPYVRAVLVLLTLKINYTPFIVKNIDDSRLHYSWHYTWLV